MCILHYLYYLCVLCVFDHCAFFGQIINDGYGIFQNMKTRNILLCFKSASSFCKIHNLQKLSQEYSSVRKLTYELICSHIYKKYKWLDEFMKNTNSSTSSTVWSTYAFCKFHNLWKIIVGVKNYVAIVTRISFHTLSIWSEYQFH